MMLTIYLPIRCAKSDDLVAILAHSITGSILLEHIAEFGMTMGMFEHILHANYIKRSRVDISHKLMVCGIMSWKNHWPTLFGISGRYDYFVDVTDEFGLIINDSYYVGCELLNDSDVALMQEFDACPMCTTSYVSHQQRVTDTIKHYTQKIIGWFRRGVI
jgi:hypothetical protein